MNYVMGEVKTKCAFVFTVTLPFLNGILISSLGYEKIRYNAEGVLEIVHNLPSRLFWGQVTLTDGGTLLVVWQFRIIFTL